MVQGRKSLWLEWKETYKQGEGSKGKTRERPVDLIHVLLFTLKLRCEALKQCLAHNKLLVLIILI